MVVLVFGAFPCPSEGLVNKQQMGGGVLFLDSIQPPQSTCEVSHDWSSPWSMMHCLREQESLSMTQQTPAANVTGPGVFFGESARGFSIRVTLGICIFLVGVTFTVFTLKDVHRFIMLLIRLEEVVEEVAEKGSDVPAIKARQDTKVSMSPPRWSFIGLIGLTSYRFYTGFMTATWLPYLLAMEGETLFPQYQSLFMGLAKLIYGVTILLNPIFGLVGDQAVSLSHGVGRRLFIRIGITFAAVGIYICVLSASAADMLSFLAGILVWRLGEAINDVTTEAIVPEMVPQEQYQMASGIKACSFLLGGLLGYIILYLTADVNYRWLYYAYPIGMFTCCIPPLSLLSEDRPVGLTHRIQQQPFGDSLWQAYVAPTKCKGGFPTACLAVFTFSLGTSPMFFLLLIVRDLVGVSNTSIMQREFSFASILFFLLSAIAAVAISLPGKSAPVDPDQPLTRRTKKEIEGRGFLLRVCMLFLGVVVAGIPALALLPHEKSRHNAFYVICSVFGTFFGAAFALFQDLTWEMLPQDVNMANVMGFNVMSRLFGIGLGNFLAGLILDAFYNEHNKGDRVYYPSGYLMMCTLSSIAVFTATYLTAKALKTHLDYQEELAADTSGTMPRAA